MKQFIYGALSTFSVVAAYHLFKGLTNKKKTSVATCNNVFNNLTKDEESKNRDGDIKQPKLVSFNKEYLNERKALVRPSGFELIHSDRKGDFFFKHDIQNVLDNTDEKVIVLDAYGRSKRVILELGAEYTTIDLDDLKEDIYIKYIRTRGEDNPFKVSPLSERVTCFNIQDNDNVEDVLKYVFTKALATAENERKFVWFYIPEFMVTEYYSKQIWDLSKDCRMGGVILTAAVSIAALEYSEWLKLSALNFDYLAITEDFEQYKKSFSEGFSSYLNHWEHIYQFDMDKYIEQDELQEMMKHMQKEQSYHRD